jgi:carboxypeptidase family protein
MKLSILALAVVLGVGACARPVVDTGARPPGVGGTIAGSVRASGQTTPLSGRKITAVNEATGSKYETSTAENGGYTLKVPSGTYRLDVELRQGEAFESRPDATLSVGVGDIDASRDFVVTVRR